MDFFNFLCSFPSSVVLNYFTIARSPTLGNSSIFNLFNWDNFSWTSENLENSFFNFLFNQGFSFKIEGFKIRTSDRYFPISWELYGITAGKHEIPIKVLKSDQSLCDKYAEMLYQVTQEKPFRGFGLIQTGLNSEGTHHFSISGIEFFGILLTSEI